MACGQSFLLSRQQATGGLCRLRCACPERSGCSSGETQSSRWQSFTWVAAYLELPSLCAASLGGLCRSLAQVHRRLRQQPAHKWVVLIACLVDEVHRDL